MRILRVSSFVFFVILFHPSSLFFIFILILIPHSLSFHPHSLSVPVGNRGWIFSSVSSRARWRSSSSSSSSASQLPQSVPLCRRRSRGRHRRIRAYFSQVTMATSCCTISQLLIGQVLCRHLSSTNDHLIQSSPPYSFLHPPPSLQPQICGSQLQAKSGTSSSHARFVRLFPSMCH